jgi:hypothetical protein
LRRSRRSRTPAASQAQAGTARRRPACLAAHQPFGVQDVEGVQEAVRDAAQHPSPLAAVGSARGLERARRSGTATVLVLAHLGGITGVPGDPGGPPQARLPVASLCVHRRAGLPALLELTLGWCLMRALKKNSAPRQPGARSAEALYRQERPPRAQAVRAEAGVALGPLHAWLAARGCELADGGALAAGEHSTVGALLAGGAAAALSPLVQAATYVDHHGQASVPVA